MMVSRIAKALEALVEWAGRLCDYFVLAMVFVITVNVVLRYVFSFGWIWAQQLEWHFMFPITLIGMSYALKHGEHVRVDILYDRYPERWKEIVNVATGFAAIFVGLAMIYLALPYVAKSFAIMESSYERGGVPYRFVIKGLIPVGFGLLAVQGLAMILLNLLRLAGRTKP